MTDSPAKVVSEIDGWLFGVQRSLIHQRTEFALSLVMAGIYHTPKIISNPK